MKVIARTYDFDRLSLINLKEGKVYDVISYQERIATSYNPRFPNVPGTSIRTDDFINPKEPRFFIKVINENGIEHDYWNDYFLSSEEVRDMKLEELL